MPRLSRYAGANAELVDHENRIRAKRPTLVNLSRKGNRYKCLICGEEILTYVHAEKHGYESKDEMINRGLAVMIGSRKGKENIK